MSGSHAPTYPAIIIHRHLSTSDNDSDDSNSTSSSTGSWISHPTFTNNRRTRQTSGERNARRRADITRGASIDTNIGDDQSARDITARDSTVHVPGTLERATIPESPPSYEEVLQMDCQHYWNSTSHTVVVDAESPHFPYNIPSRAAGQSLLTSHRGLHDTELPTFREFMSNQDLYRRPYRCPLLPSAPSQQSPPQSHCMARPQMQPITSSQIHPAASPQMYPTAPHRTHRTAQPRIHPTEVSICCVQ